MLLEILMSASVELKNAVAEGYDLFLFFQDGNVLSEMIPGLTYPIAQVTKQPRPCHSLQGNVYRVILPDGKKGFAIVSWVQDNDE